MQKKKTINLFRLELREPSFLCEKGVLQVFVNGKPVYLPVPNSITDIDLACELDAPTCEPTLNWVYGWLFFSYHDNWNNRCYRLLI